MVETGLTAFVYAGNRRILEFTVTDEDAGDGSAKDLTGFDVKFSVARLASGVPVVSSPEIDLELADAQITVPTPTNGVVLVELLEENTADLAPGGQTVSYYMELEVFDGSDNSTVVATGTFEVRPNVVNA